MLFELKKLKSTGFQTLLFYIEPYFIVSEAEIRNENHQILNGCAGI